MGNASSHPSPESLVSECGEITCVFLPPNVTSLVQPMDQEVLENLKGRYKRQKLMLDLASPLSLLAHHQRCSAQSWDHWLSSDEGETGVQ